MKLKIALAPMAGITDSAFRLMNVLGGADLVYSEMAHVSAISHGSKKTFEMLKVSPFEFPYIVQLFGNDPKYYAEATRIISKNGVPVMRYKAFSDKQMEYIEKLTTYDLRLTTFYSRFITFQNQLKIIDNKRCVKPSGFDINLGCPARKVCGHGSGAALWKDLAKVRQILEAVINNTDLPVSIKTRVAVGETTVLELLEIIKDLPIKRVMIHGRTLKQGFSGPIDTKIIKNAIKKYPQFEFWVNGGIIDRKSALEIAKKAGCNNLGIARGAYGNPLLAEEIKTKKVAGSKKQDNIHHTNIQCVLAYIHSILAYQSKGKHGIIEIRKHLCWYFKDFPGAKAWRKKLVMVENVKDIEKILINIASKVK